MGESEHPPIDVSSLSPANFGQVLRVRGWVSDASEENLTIRSTAPLSCSELIVRCVQPAPPEVQKGVTVIVTGISQKKSRKAVYFRGRSHRRGDRP
jgi:hypothetical protein